jgi:hypothetical protein
MSRPKESFGSHTAIRYIVSQDHTKWSVAKGLKFTSETGTINPTISRNLSSLLMMTIGDTQSQILGSERHEASPRKCLGDQGQSRGEIGERREAAVQTETTDDREDLGKIWLLDGKSKTGEIEGRGSDAEEGGRRPRSMKRRWTAEGLLHQQPIFSSLQSIF